MLFANKVANNSNNNTPSSLCIQHPKDPSKPIIQGKQRHIDDDSSNCSLVDTDTNLFSATAMPEQQQQQQQQQQRNEAIHTTSTGSHSRTEEPLPMNVIPLKPRARLPNPDLFPNGVPSAGQGIRKQDFRSLPCLPQPELSSPSASTPTSASTSASTSTSTSTLSPSDVQKESGDDVDDIPDLISEDDNAAAGTTTTTTTTNTKDTNEESSPSDWPVHTQPANLPSALKKNTAATTTTNTKNQTITLSLPSISSNLRRPASSLRKRPATRRRVHGLWNVDVDNVNNAKDTKDTKDAKDANCFEDLRDETLEHIFSYLDLADLCRAGMVGRRFKSVVHNTAALWKRIDATSFVQQAHNTFKQNHHLTGQAMEAILKLHKPESLTIRDIHNSLSADVYLPSISSLKELTLTHYENLTDTHVHVMLLMTLKKQSNELQVLKLEDCPLLSNASIRSITATCTNLTHLSLMGNVQMTDVIPLAPLLATKDAPVVDLPTAAPTTSLASLQAFFAPPPTPSTPTRPPMSPPRQERPSTPPNAATSSLQSLFAPPGMSPPRKSTTLQASLSGSASSSLSSSLRLTASSNSKNHATAQGKLRRLNLQGTKITANSFLQCLRKRLDASKNNTKLVANLSSLHMNGETWTDALLGDFSQHVALEEMEELSFATTYNNSSSSGTNNNRNSNKASTSATGQLTNKGLKAMARNATPRFSKLHTLDLSGQTSFTGMGLAGLVSNSASPKLNTLQINHCRGVASDPKGMDRLAKALVKNKRSLRSLHMRGCMSETASCHPSALAQLNKEYACWHQLVETVPELCLSHLDVRECWTTTASSSSQDTTTSDCNSNNNNQNTNDVETLRSAVSTVLY